jgi:hypothetical protein
MERCKSFMSYINASADVQTKFPGNEEREALGKRIGLTPRQVQVWFQVSSYLRTPSQKLTNRTNVKRSERKSTRVKYLLVRTHKITMISINRPGRGNSV